MYLVLIYLFIWSYTAYRAPDLKKLHLRCKHCGLREILIRMLRNVVAITYFLLKDHDRLAIR
jgi:hypothetical protein